MFDFAQAYTHLLWGHRVSLTLNNIKRIYYRTADGDIMCIPNNKKHLEYKIKSFKIDAISSYEWNLEKDNKFLITTKLNGDDRFSLYYAGFSDSEMTEEELTDKLNLYPDEFLEDSHEEYEMYEDLEDDDYGVDIIVTKLTPQELEDCDYMTWFDHLSAYDLDNLTFIRVNIG
jgi:hypothetical protein